MPTPTLPALKELPPELQPRRRIEWLGPGSLTTSELLSLVIGSGRPGENAIRLAETVLVESGGLHGLRNMPDSALQEIPGIGPAKAAQIRAALELGRRFIAMPPDTRPQIRSPADAANLVLVEMSALEREELRVLLLDTKLFVKRMVTVYQGNLNTAVVRVGEVFREAIRDQASCIVVLHNHPSNDPTPSPEDVRVTEQIVEAGKLLDIEVVDHLVVAGHRYVSLKERGLGFSRI